MYWLIISLPFIFNNYVWVQLIEKTLAMDYLAGFGPYLGLILHPYEEGVTIVWVYAGCCFPHIFWFCYFNSHVF